MQTVICSLFVAVFPSSNQFSCVIPVFQGSPSLPIRLGSPSLPVFLGSPNKLQFHTQFNDMQSGICSRSEAVFPASSQFFLGSPFSLVPLIYQISWVPPTSCNFTHIQMTCNVICSHSAAVCKPTCKCRFDRRLQFVSSSSIRYVFRINLSTFFLHVASCSPPFLTT